MKHLILISFLLLQITTFSQEKYPQNYFRTPLEIPIVLSGSFGELRSNHFHAGVDIKTQGREGLHVLATADGYVSRIKVQQFGYGKAIYIAHPNGYTSVYGHLSKFNDTIEKYVKSIQYKKESYATGNLYFKKNTFPVKKGEIIAFSGDTGGSGAPHLHYEIRNTASENIINPLLFGLKVKDTKSPTFRSLKVYSLSDDARVNQQKKSFQISIKNIGNGIYTADRITASGEIGFGVSVFDRLNGAPNKNGIYSLEMLVNGERFYYHDVETFSFSESKYLNLHIDYEHYKKYKRRYQKTHKVAANKLSIYESLLNNGKIDIKKAMNYSVQIIAKDFKGNISSIKIPVAGKESNAIFTELADTTNYKVKAKKFNKFTKENVTIAFPKNTFYEDVFLDFTIDKEIAKIHTPTIPLHKSFTLTFNVSKYSEPEREQLYIANLEYPKYPRYQYTRKRDSTFYTTTKTLGNYTLLADNQKPKINLLYFKDQQWITNSETIKVKISDTQSGIKDYNATIDGEWVLMEYNHKKNILTYNFSDKKLVGSKHIFNLVVSDNVGNTNTLSATFFKKQIN
ncbi:MULTISPECIES: M23 family metallopeptidase [unclassified Polaribacter]|uniref:M23 family metallopeptidase n=1 Tax=unclassified Polaribacter TaxID=196858 RepID=UPI0011BD7D1C|nr:MULTISPECIES: M23 family metallopeptidase [unclassified Polaribacter]TXD52867.1 M23 family metallopeptidase [Polaribacter sp. IC063]TXD60813.1 M23 family metallopeptidase [Polaribacter sp. IC066]